jgi:hypothetical protein
VPDAPDPSCLGWLELDGPLSTRAVGENWFLEREGACAKIRVVALVRCKEGPSRMLVEIGG